MTTAMHQVMSYAAIYDLHWEVKVNALYFWDKVIERLIADQGMIDGAFPSVTFSKEHKKIVTLTETEIKHRLNKVLQELSSTGCLYVLVTAVNDECDYQVVQTSVSIISDLLALLRRYHVIETVAKGDKKRKTSDESCCEKRKPVDPSDSMDASEDSEIGSKSDRIIEDIVNEFDINLLVGVCRSTNQGLGHENGQVSIQSLKPDVFLDRMQCTNFKSLLEEKSKWLQDSQNDLNTMINDLLTTPQKCDTNILDCY